MSFSVSPVLDSSSLKAFQALPLKIYQDDPNWVCPLHEELEDVFDREKNGNFADGDARRWIMRDGKGEVVGRIAAFFHRKEFEKEEVPMGGIGFFECIDDEEAAHTLFDTAKKWLEEQGVEGMDGPVNFGANDRNWGLLVEGYTHPSYGMNYHPPYYKKFFESYGFTVFFEQVSRHLDLSQPIPERFAKIARWIANKPNIRFEHARIAEMEKYTEHFRLIYNEAWKFHRHFSEMKPEGALRLAKALKHVVIEKFMIFAYVNDEPAGFLFCLPDLNQIFKPMNGKFPLWKKLLFKWRSRNDYAWYRKRGILDRARVIVIGVVPKFQKFGLESGLTMFSMEDAKAMGFREIELSWVGDFNPMSRKLQDATNAKPGKTHVTYRFFFDPERQAKKAAALKADPRDKQKKKEDAPAS